MTDNIPRFQSGIMSQHLNSNTQLIYFQHRTHLQQLNSHWERKYFGSETETFLSLLQEFVNVLLLYVPCIKRWAPRYWINRWAPWCRYLFMRTAVLRQLAPRQCCGTRNITEIGGHRNTAVTSGHRDTAVEDGAPRHCSHGWAPQHCSHRWAPQHGGNRWATRNTAVIQEKDKSATECKNKKTEMQVWTFCWSERSLH